MRAGEEGHDGVGWYDGSLCSLGRVQSSLGQDDRERIISTRIRRERRMEERGQEPDGKRRSVERRRRRRGSTGGREEKRLICEVNVSPKVGFCQVQPVRPREPERYVYICVYTPNIYTCPPSLSRFLANRRFFSSQSFIGDLLHFRSTCYTYGSHYSEGKI